MITYIARLKGAWRSYDVFPNALLSSVIRRHMHQGLFPVSLPSLDRNDVLEKLQNAGISKIAFLRHGKTAAPIDGVDFNRMLTKEGKEQSKEAGRVFRSKIMPLFPIVVASPSPRTMETAQLFINEIDSNNDFINIVPLQIIYDGTMQPGGNAIFKKLGYASLLEYLHNQSDMVDRVKAQDLLGNYFLDVTHAIMNLFDSLDSATPVKKDSTLLVVGHAIYLPAVAFGIAKLLRSDNESIDVVLKSITGEAEGYLVDLRTLQINYLAR